MAKWIKTSISLIFSQIMANTHNLFINHSWQYSNAYNGLCSLLNNENYFSYLNYSAPKDNPIHTNGNDKELMLAIYNRLRLCYVVLIMGGVYSTRCKWIKKEILIANQSFSVPKPIIGIKSWGQTNISSQVSNNAVEIVGWNTESIVAAIRKHSNV